MTTYNFWILATIAWSAALTSLTVGQSIILIVLKEELSTLEIHGKSELEQIQILEAIKKFGSSN